MIKNFVKILELLGDRLEVCVSVFSNNKFTLVNTFSRNGHSPRKSLLTFFAELKQSLKMSSQSSSV